MHACKKSPPKNKHYCQIILAYLSHRGGKGGQNNVQMFQRIEKVHFWRNYTSSKKKNINLNSNFEACDENPIN